MIQLRCFSFMHTRALVGGRAAAFLKGMGLWVFFCLGGTRGFPISQLRTSTPLRISRLNSLKPKSKGEKGNGNRRTIQLGS